MNNSTKNVLRIIAGVIVGVVVGMFVNGGLISLSGSIIPLPEGVDPNDFESLQENIHLFKAKHFIMPFLAHALGTFFGALVACFIAGKHQLKVGLGMGLFFIIGGIMAVKMIPAPMWFNALDLLVAYIPMGLLAGKIASLRTAN